MLKLLKSQDKGNGEEFKMIEIGRLCIKTAGRDAKLKCVVIDIIDDNFVIVDGETRRKKVNMRHLEPTQQKLAIKKGASSAEISRELKKLGIEMKEKKSKKPKARPKKVRKSAAKPAAQKEVKKK